MSTLNARARRVVEGARRAAEPTDGDRARVRAALIMRIGASAFNAPGGGGGSPANGASGASPVGSTLPAGRVAPTMFKGLGAVLLVGAAIFAAHMLTRQADPTAAVPSTQTVVETVAIPVSPTSIAVAPLPFPAASMDAGVESSPLLVKTPVSSDRRKLAQARPASNPSTHEERRAEPVSSAGVAHLDESVSAPSASSTLAEELALLRDAQAALREQDFNGSLAKLDEMAAHHPNGVLREERMAARVIALCAAGRRDEARVEADRFLRTMPHSVQTGRVRASCAFDTSSTSPP
jgi:hypothetical protein